MELKFKREERKYQVEEIKLTEQDSITMVELFVKNKLPETAQEVFYEELKNQEVTTINVKEALYQAVLSNVSINLLKYGIEQYENNPEQFQKEVQNYL